MKKERKERKKRIEKRFYYCVFIIMYRYLISITLVLLRLRYIFHQSLHLSINCQQCLLFIMICLLITLEQLTQSSFPRLAIRQLINQLNDCPIQQQGTDLWCQPSSLETPEIQSPKNGSQVRGDGLELPAA